MAQNIKVLLSFVGTNDAGVLQGKPDGAILTALKNDKFNTVYLFFNDSNEHDFFSISKYLKSEIIRLGLAEEVNLILLDIKDVTDHNLIYTSLKDFCDKLNKNKNYYAAISSGTPAMQVCWILLAESGDFSIINPLKLIKIKDPRFGKSENVPVKIGTSLPKIIRLNNEVEALKNELIPPVIFDTNKPELIIDGISIPTAPIELSYYFYFLQRSFNSCGFEKFSGYWTTKIFLKKIIEIHESFFPFLDLNRIELKKYIKSDNGLPIGTFRGNISKINKKIKIAVNKNSLIELFKISTEGSRGAKYYGIKADKEKIIIK
jgi:hypothetical protein